VYDVEIDHLDWLAKFHSFECHIILYPYSRKISSKDFSFTPFEEYVKDIASHQRSAYTRIDDHFNNIFGLGLGLVITFLFLIFNKEDLFAIESIVSVICAYMIGKDLWSDIEKFLIDLSKDWRLRYCENYYLYQLEKNTTLTQYSYHAKKQRYGIAPLLPEKMDYIEQSNSQTVRMHFDRSGLPTLDSDSAHIMTINVNPNIQEELTKSGFLFGVKLSFNKKFLGWVRSYEIFQSLDKNSKGCMNDKGQWIDGSIFYRKTMSLGRLKFFWKKGLIPGQELIDF
ncbi:MAG: hypothetical protein AB1656_04270, partial [Candidatus Omnitrophota bacterium]